MEAEPCIHGTDGQLSEGKGSRAVYERRWGVSQRTCMYDPWTQTAVWRWPEGRGAGAGWRWA